MLDMERIIPLAFDFVDKYGRCYENGCKDGISLSAPTHFYPRLHRLPSHGLPIHNTRDTMLISSNSAEYLPTSCAKFNGLSALFQRERHMFKQNRSVDRKLIFVLMPFSQDMKLVYQKIQQVVIQEHGLFCVRGDDLYTTGIIVEEIWNKIQEAQIIIADATGKNPNVFYEMGLAHALGKNVIILTQHIDDIPFDLRHRRMIVYDKERLDVLALNLSLTIGELKWNSFQINQWLETNQKSIRVGISSPTDMSSVNKTPIPAFGQVEGLPPDEKYMIVGYVTTNQEYEQGGAEIDKYGYWKIDEIHLGALTHKLYFKIFDGAGHIIAESQELTIIKRAGSLG